MITSKEISNTLKEVENNGKKSIIEFFQSHNLTKMELWPNDKLDMVPDVYDEYETALSSCMVYALGHARDWVELIVLYTIELKQDGDNVELYCYGMQECNEYEGEYVELLPESYAEILEFLETVEPYLEYYK